MIKNLINPKICVAKLLFCVAPQNACILLGCIYAAVMAADFFVDGVGTASLLRSSKIPDFAGNANALAFAMSPAF